MKYVKRRWMVPLKEHKKIFDILKKKRKLNKIFRYMKIIEDPIKYVNYTLNKKRYEK